MSNLESAVKNAEIPEQLCTQGELLEQMTVGFGELEDRLSSVLVDRDTAAPEQEPGRPECRTSLGTQLLVSNDILKVLLRRLRWIIERVEL